jgi:hypothetical protein
MAGKYYLAYVSPSNYKLGGPGSSPVDPTFIAVPTSRYGDASDGALHFDGSSTVAGLWTPVGGIYTLTRPCFASTCLIDAGVTVKVASWPMLGQVSLINNGIIDDSGVNGVGSTGVGGNNPAGMYSARIGGNGQSGAGAIGTGGAGFNCGSSGAGGAGSSGAAGPGSSPSSATNPRWPYRMIDPLYTGTVQFGSTTRFLGGTPGGGGGGGDGSVKGGGGASSGGLIFTAFPDITNNGVIQAIGGNGGSPGSGNAGGGGGGAGGNYVALTLEDLINNGTFVFTHGNGGAGSGTGAAGANGTDGNVWLPLKLH